MDPSRLDKEALTYELGLRGIAMEGKVDRLRAKLASILKVQNEVNWQMASPKNQQPDTELEYCQRRLKDVQEILKDPASRDRKHSSYRKIKTLLIHIQGRTARIVPETSEQENVRSSLLNKCLGYLMELGKVPVVTDGDGEGTSAQDTSTEDVKAVESDQESQVIGLESDSSHRSESDSSSDDISSRSGRGKRRRLLKDWGIKFNGTSLSVCAFLQEVSRLRRSENISRRDLLRCAGDLFEGRALVWFKATLPLVSSWNELKDRLIQEFQPSSYEEHLWAEIYERTQGADEPIAIYVAIMRNYFQRLPKAPTVKRQVQVVRRGMLPYLRDRLSLVELSSLDKLVRLGKQLEDTRADSALIRPPPTNPQGLSERDLMYVPMNRPPRLKVSAIDGSTREPNRTTPSGPCWNCGRRGHPHNKCPNPQGFYCWGCGERGVARPNCPKCKSKTSGNGNRGRREVD